MGNLFSNSSGARFLILGTIITSTILLIPTIAHACCGPELGGGERPSWTKPEPVCTKNGVVVPDADCLRFADQIPPANCTAQNCSLSDHDEDDGDDGDEDEEEEGIAIDYDPGDPLPPGLEGMDYDDLLDDEADFENMQDAQEAGFGEDQLQDVDNTCTNNDDDPLCD